MKRKSNANERLFNDSVNKHNQRVYLNKVELQPKAENEWRMRLMASNLLNVPQVDPIVRPLTTSRSLEPTRSKNPLEFEVHINNTHHFGSFPGKKVVQIGGSTEPKNVRVQIPKMTRPTTQQRPKSILEGPLPGVVAFAEPVWKTNRKVSQMVPCYSSIVHFYDQQGTY